MSQNKLNLDDIFADDEFGILDAKPQTTYIKTEDDRLIDEFEEINQFIDKNERKPSKSSMSEFSLLAKLNKFRQDESKKKILKPFDRHNLLGYVKIDVPTLDDIFDDDSGILDTDSSPNTSDDIFTYRHIPKESERAKTDFVSRRKPLSEREFAPYEKIFHQVHQEIKEGKRRIIEFKDVESQLHEGRFYIIDGIMLYLEEVDFGRDDESLSKNTTRRKDGRTRTIFENGTLSNMYYRSVGKAIYNGGRKMVSELTDKQPDLFIDSDGLTNEDEKTGYVYVLKSKSTHPDIQGIANLHKIGFATANVEERIKNAKNEATYLFADVEIIATYKIINRNADKLERLLHKLFAKACLDIELTNEQGKHIDPREWFVVPYYVIDEAISLIINENVLNYEYNETSQKLELKK